MLRRPDGGVVVGVLARDTVVRELVVGQLDILAGVTVEVGTTVEVRDIVRLEVVGRAVVVERAAQRRLVEERSQEWARLIFVDSPRLIGRTGRQDSIEDDGIAAR